MSQEKKITLEEAVISIWKSRGNGDASQLIPFSFDEVVELMKSGARLQQEQPSEDLEEEIKRYEASLPESATVDPFEGYPTLKDIASHFYELGKQAKKDLENKSGWHNVSEEMPEFGDTVIVACKNKNKEDGIWLYDLIHCWEGKFEPRENWETPLKWISVDELGKQSKEPVSNDLEEAAEKFVYDWAGLSPTERRIAERSYLAGAEWQKERSTKPFPDEFMKKVISIWKTRANGEVSQPVQFSFDETIALLRAGAEWQKRQMLKGAVERTVKIDSGGYPYIDITAELYDYEHNVPLAKEGELVKIVIVKEEEK